jgi:hypothetical protein
VPLLGQRDTFFVLTVLDAAILGMLVLGFATLVTAHVALVFVLTVKHRPRWRGLAALALPPLAPLWGWQSGHKKAAGIWVGAVVVYTLGLTITLAR